MQKHPHSSQTLAKPEIEHEKELEPCGAGASWADASTAADASKRHPIFHFLTINGFFTTLFSFINPIKFSKKWVSTPLKSC
jgi:hypothetical protein